MLCNVYLIVRSFSQLEFIDTWMSRSLSLDIMPTHKKKRRGFTV